MSKKTYQGPIKNRERTKQKFLDAVSEIITSKGYTGLGVNQIAKQAGMNKSLIYSYFGNVNNLIQQCVRSNDFWILTNQNIQCFIEEHDPSEIELLKFILSNQKDYFADSNEMQKFIAWQVSEKSQIMNEVSLAGEKINAEYFEFATQKSAEIIDLKAVYSIFVSSIYFLTLFSKNNTSTFCGIDLKEQNGFDRIISTMFQMCELLSENKTKYEKVPLISK